MAEKTWKHPEFGTFTYDGYHWVASVDLPAFAAFTYRPRFGGGGTSTGTCELRVEVDDDEGAGDPCLPPADVLAAVSRVLASQADLAPRVVAALWDDFNGRGPDSGMWWHGSLDAVTEDVDPALPPLTGPAALYAWRRLAEVGARAGASPDGPPRVELRFEAPFEEEHGVGVLTDGTAVLGTGYSCDVDPFDAGDDK